MNEIYRYDLYQVMIKILIRKKREMYHPVYKLLSLTDDRFNKKIAKVLAFYSNKMF